jgi:uncharacterized membrane protein YagU involved in acid resistance
MSLLGAYSIRQISLAILIGGLAAGTIDIFSASAINHVGPGIILRAIASGLLGKAAFTGGSSMIVIGLALQWIMSLIIAKIYVLAGTRLPILYRRPVTMGVLYGVGVFLVMNLVVVPLSASPVKHSHPTPLLIGLNLAAMILFGLIVALTPWFMKMRPASPMAA